MKLFEYIEKLRKDKLNNSLKELNKKCDNKKLYTVIFVTNEPFNIDLDKCNYVSDFLVEDGSIFEKLQNNK